MHIFFWMRGQVKDTLEPQSLVIFEWVYEGPVRNTRNHTPATKKVKPVTTLQQYCESDVYL